MDELEQTVLKRENKFFRWLIGQLVKHITLPLTDTFWNGERCKARKCVVFVGKAEKPTFWYADLEGKMRRAVEITYGERTFYIDNEDEIGWLKVTMGKGSPQWGHASLNILSVHRYE